MEKSAVFKAAATANNAKFCLSQNRCSAPGTGVVTNTGIEGSMNGVGASGSTAASGAWACKAQQAPHTTNNKAFRRKKSSKLRIFIRACRGRRSSYEGAIGCPRFQYGN